MQKIDAQYAECEADIIDASGGDIELTSTGTVNDPKCLSGHTCFRVWITAQASAVYLGDTEGDEAAASCP